MPWSLSACTLRRRPSIRCGSWSSSAKLRDRRAGARSDLDLGQVERGPGEQLLGLDPARREPLLVVVAGERVDLLSILLGEAVGPEVLAHDLARFVVMVD